MDKSFWDERWRDNRIGFHEAAPNALLTGHLNLLGLAPGSRVFVPLCGKSVDLDWLLTRGYAVAGIEFFEPAIAEVFDRLGMTPKIETVSGVRRYSAGSLVLFAGDVFDLTADLLGPVDAIYDRAALVALPPETRGRYADHLSAICGYVPQLLVTLSYDQSLTDGPPFSVPAAEVTALYGSGYAITKQFEHPISGPVAKRAPGQEILWSLKPL